MDEELQKRELCMTSLSKNQIQFDSSAYNFCQKAIDVGDIKWNTTPEDIKTMYGYYQEQGFI